jgi:hypothetical protein
MVASISAPRTASTNDSVRKRAKRSSRGVARTPPTTVAPTRKTRNMLTSSEERVST